MIDSHVSNNIFQKVETIVVYNSLTNFIAIPILLIIGNIEPLSWALLLLILLVSLIDTFYQIPYYYAVKHVDTSIMAALFSIGKIIVPILAYFVVGEHLTYSQYA